MGRRAPLSFIASAIAVVACSSSSPSAPAASDAGFDAGVDSAPPPYVPIGGADAGSSSGGPTLDGGSKSCADLQTAVNAAANAAAVCDPSQASQCTGVTQGICCGITVSFGTDPSLIDNVQAAVAAYHNAGCSIDCTKFPCETAPSRVCVGSNRTGTCQ